MIHHYYPMTGPQPIVLPFGRTDRKFMAGPVRFSQAWMWTVCLTSHVAIPTTIHYPIQDFSVPTDLLGLEDALRRTTYALMRKEPVYVGCAGGVGRTGLFLSCLLKVLHPDCTDPVRWLRKIYWPHAVETPSQEKFIADWVPSRSLQLTSLVAGTAAPLFSWRKGMFR